ncbi:alcohol dehydrogenase GroES-like domain-containing protein [Colletotrichum truncatum]|uniref:Alcohol dehydrogenase GroES-like domain-containing protein n=1 Tax=Colletotrichum truncatum TaxID=5467 RepID=A0ACC3YVZ7_COLTU|nr:alcohol dehydrogenase GroES-like domain-containing protein [Colletotrichum truncatum]KAF6791170.1 alcohol dehydrogenase GroES-like domain-containing protein [Colletotrichum truncatum]
MTAAEIPKTMKAAQVVEFNKPYVINTVPVPTDLGPLDILVKIAVASYCHTDTVVQMGYLPVGLPLTASHEGSGTVVAVGSSVTNFKPGDRAMCGVPLGLCGECAECTGPENYTHYCTKQKGILGIQVDGCFAEYVRADSRTSVLIPGSVSLLSAAPLACAGRSAWRGVLQAGLEKGQWLAFVGSGGGLGHLGIQMAKDLGLRVIGIDVRDEGLELSRKSGADVVLDAREGNAEVVSKLQEATGGVLADATVNLADADQAAGLACAVTKMHGTMHQLAQPAEVKIPFMELILRNIKVRGSLTCSRGETVTMVEHIEKHGIKLENNIFHGLDKIHEALELVHSGKISGKAVIIVDEEQVENDKKTGTKY